MDEKNSTSEERAALVRETTDTSRAEKIREGHADLAMRRIDAMRVGTFGVSFLNDAIGGIRPCDLTIIGARTGVGKSEMAVRIATANAAAGKAVCFFALEAEPHEMQRRIRYQIIAEHFFANRSSFPSDIELNFTDWLAGRYGIQLEALDYFAIEQYAKKTENLEIISPGVTDFTKRDFSMMYEDAVSRGAELVILDHIHYLAADDREGEYEHTKRTMWRLRDLINAHRVPVIALSHLRKEDRFAKSFVPTIDELHGSSEISKQANHVISLAPIYKLPRKLNLKEFAVARPGTTGMRVLKSRTGHGGCSRYIAVNRFDLTKNDYEERYAPYKTDQWASELEPVGLEKFERWMSGAREAEN